MSKKDSDESTISFGIEDNSASEGSPFSFILLAVGLAGVLLGVVAIYLVYSGSGKTGEMRDATQQLEARLESRLDTLEEQIARLSARQDGTAANQESLERTIRSLGNQTQNVIGQFGTDLNRMQENINSQARSLRELTEALNETRSAVRRPAAAATTAPAAADATQTTAEASSGPRAHQIASGDTFARLAMRYGVSVDAILEANPDADPRRLQIGQRIIIPDKTGD